MPGLTPEQVDELLAGPIIARPATVKPDGPPTSCPSGSTGKRQTGGRHARMTEQQPQVRRHQQVRRASAQGGRDGSSSTG